MIPGIVAQQAALNAGGSAYTGPLDLVPGADWIWGWSAKFALSSAMLGQSGYTLRRSSDDAELAFAYDATTGEIDAAAVTAWAAGNSFAKSVVDHTGNSLTVSQATAGNQSQWSATAANSKPGLIRTGAPADLDSSGAALNFDNGFTGFAVVSAPDTRITPLFNIAGTDCGSILASYYANQSPNRIELYNSNENCLDEIGVFGDADAVDELVIFEFKIGPGDVLSVKINGQAVSLDAPAGTFGSIGDITALQLRTLEGQVNAEHFCANGLLSDENCTAIRQNVATRWGITLP